MKPSKELIEKAARAIARTQRRDIELWPGFMCDAGAALSAVYSDIRAQARAEALEEAAQAVESHDGIFQWPSEMTEYGAGFADSRAEAAGIVRSLAGRATP